MVYTSVGQVAAILPSNTPVGEGTATVRLNGSVVDTGPIRVVASSFGIFTLNQQGIGPAVATDPLGGATPYSFTNSAAPGDFVDIWGTGLGATSAPDDGAPLPANRAEDIKLFVAGVEVPVQYAGRSGCCSGVDIVRFIAPENLTGCYLPVTVTVNGLPSNYGSISIAENGDVCSSDPLFGLPDFSQLQNGGTFSQGVVSLIKTRQPSNLGVAQALDQVSDFITATYQQITVQNVAQFTGASPISILNACTVYPFRQGTAAFPQIITPVSLDAGDPLQAMSPVSSSSVPKVGTNYIKNFGTGVTFLAPGVHTVSAPGGADVGAHTASIVAPQAFEWTNVPAIGAPINRSEPMLIEFNSAGYDYVFIAGTAIADFNFSGVNGAGFFCWVDASMSSFSIPSEILMGLPDSPVVQGFATGGVTVGGYKVGDFDAPGIDLGLTLYTDTLVSTVDFN